MTMLMHFDPFRDFDRLTEQLLRGRVAAPRMMPMDAFRHGDHFVVHFDLPGVDPNSIELTVENNALTVKAERSWHELEGDEVVASGARSGPSPANCSSATVWTPNASKPATTRECSR